MEDLAEGEIGVLENRGQSAIVVRIRTTHHHRVKMNLVASPYGGAVKTPKKRMEFLRGPPVDKQIAVGAFYHGSVALANVHKENLQAGRIPDIVFKDPSSGAAPGSGYNRRGSKDSQLR